MLSTLHIWLVQKDFPVIIPKTILIMQLVKTTRRLYDQTNPEGNNRKWSKPQGFFQKSPPSTHIEASCILTGYKIMYQHSVIFKIFEIQ